MRSASVDALKLDLYDALGNARSGPMRAQAETTGKLPIVGLALGKAKVGRSFKLAAIVQPGTPESTLRKVQRAAAGEVQVVRMPLCAPRVTRAWAKKPKAIGEIGEQVGPEGFGWVGTGSIFMRSAVGDLYLQLTNEHVAGMGAPKGRRMHQGGRFVGTVYATGGIDLQAINQVDCASIAQRPDRTFFGAWDHGLKGNITKVRQANEDDLNQRATNTGQTEGTMYGSLWAIDVDHQPIGFEGGVGYFENMTVWVGEDGRPFSVPGHSGSTIVMLHDGAAVALLNAGGRDETGVDRTLAVDLRASMMAAGGIPEVLT